MATTHEDIERYVFNSGLDADEVAPGTWVLHEEVWGGTQIVVQHTAPLVVFRVKLFDLPGDLGSEASALLFRRLLELNGSEMVQGAYALEGDAVVAVEVMQAESLDENEFLAAVDSLQLAIVEHHDELVGLLPS